MCYSHHGPLLLHKLVRQGISVKSNKFSCNNSGIYKTTETVEMTNTSSGGRNTIDGEELVAVEV